MQCALSPVARAKNEDRGIFAEKDFALWRGCYVLPVEKLEAFPIENEENSEEPKRTNLSQAVAAGSARRHKRAVPVYARCSARLREYGVYFRSG